MKSNSVADGHYRIRTAGAKSDIANSISNGKKCHYVQIGIDLQAFDSLDAAKKFVEGKGLEADSMSLDFGVEPEKPEDEAAAEAEDDKAEGEGDAKK